MNDEEAKLKIRQLHQKGMSREETVTLISAIPLNGEASDVFEYIDTVYSKGLIPSKFNRTDMGNAERLVNQYGPTIRYCYERKMWLLWCGTHWHWDYGAAIMQLAQKTVRTIYEEAANEENDEERKRIADWAKASESSSRIESMVKQSQPMVAVKLSSLDKNHWLLNCQNGTIDLKTGELLAHKQEDYLTMLCPVEYKPEAVSQIWTGFLLQITDNKLPMIEYLQRCIGYSLTGDTREQIFFFAHGTGSNGKSTFLNTIRHILGPYAMQVEPETFLTSYHQQKQGHTEDIANLVGKRLVIGSEIEDGRRLATTKMKQHTGGESIRASHKHEKEFEFEVTYKIWLNGNHRPDVTDTTYSIWRRLKLLPFNVTIPADKQNRQLGNTLVKDEAAAILSWAVKGCLEWQRSGLSEPEIVQSATQKYHDEQDLLHDFIAVRCITSKDADVVILKKMLFAGYQTWCSENSIDAITQRTFNKKVAEKGYQSFISSGQAKWRYIRLKTEDELKTATVDEVVDEVDKVDLFTNSLSTREHKLNNTTLPPTISTFEAKSGFGTSTSSTVGESSSTLPDCTKCQQWDWTATSYGSFVCSCGNEIKPGGAAAV